MADLDDFFAKKDRKKSKSVKKFSTPDELTKKLDDSKKIEKTSKKDRPTQEGEDSGSTPHEQDEWKDFEEEKKDYTGLKIGHLSISGTGENNQGTSDGNSDQNQTCDESGNEPEKKSGPWKRVNAEVVEREPVRAPEPVKPTQSSTGGYVPPALRNQSQSQVPSRLKSKAAPDIHNEEFFPTLSGGKPAETGGAWGKKSREGAFETVPLNKSSSYRHAEQTKLSTGQGPKLNLGNRYGTLSNDS